MRVGRLRLHKTGCRKRRVYVACVMGTAEAVSGEARWSALRDIRSNVETC